MITDARALRTDTVPQDLHHRDGQIDHLSAVLDPTGFDAPESVTIFGPSGAGKTTLAKYVLGQLRRETLDVRWGYVDCIADPTEAAALHRLIREVGLGADLRREGAPRSEALDRLREADEHIIATLDEVGVADEELLLALSNLPGVSLVCITVDEDEWLAELSQPVISRMQSTQTLRLDKFSHAELVDILDSRVAHGLIRSRVADGAIERVADIAAGDARHAITVLRWAAQQVAERDREELTCEVVEAVAADAEADLRRRHVRSLGTHQRLLFDIIDEAGELDGETVHARYEARCEAPKSRTTRWRYLKSLEQYELIESRGQGRGTDYVSLL
ncbi:Cdc6/Cdc18 family protein [Haloarcula pelagica]|uniref:Cdc6/Cdc18 family protein n=1 Tax=Haloarcula pelagica TaxID=3033389 RepID=UPI0024C224CA|nr:AAA family ATPase [Halomicroarcula sp. YJ-61-S]